MTTLLPALPSHRHRAQTLLAIALATALFTAMPALVQAQDTPAAQQTTYAIDIAAGSLPQALAKLSAQTRVQVLYTQDEPYGKTSPAVHGQYSVAEALEKLLAGSGYTWREVRPGVVTLEKLPVRGDDAQNVIVTSALNVTGQLNDTAGENLAGSTPSSTSYGIDTIQGKYAGNVVDVLRSTPGTYTRTSYDQPGIMVNIRGMQGFGRINSMIDGVPQTFRNLSGHGGGYETLVYLDTSLLAGVDIARGAVKGAAGMGTLTGAVDFRTIDIEDVLMQGKDMGSLLRLGTGTNGVDWNSMTAFAFKDDVARIGKIGIMGAVAFRKDSVWEDANGVKGVNTKDQKPESGLLKLQYSPNDNSTLKLHAQSYSNRFFPAATSGYEWSIQRRSFGGVYLYDPASPFVNLKVTAHHDTTDISFPMDGLGSNANGAYKGRSGTDTGRGISLDNSSKFSLGSESSITMEYGLAYTDDDYRMNKSRGSNIEGKLSKSGGYTDITWMHGIWSLTGGLRYDHYHVGGITRYVSAGVDNCPAGGDPCPGKKEHRSGSELNPKILLQFAPTNGPLVYASYSRTMRPPTVSEMFFDLGYYSGAYSNPDLLPEESKTWELGTKYYLDGMFLEKDHAYVNADVFHSDIENYIGYGLGSSALFTSWVNNPDTVTMKGLELAAGYDAVDYYADLSLTVAKTKQPLPAAAGIYADVGRIPDDYATLDTGMRFLGEELVVGGRVRYIGKSTTAYFNDSNSIDIPAHSLIDLYGSYRLSDNVSINAEIENATNKLYKTSNSGWIEATSNLHGRGRTIKLNVTLRF